MSFANDFFIPRADLMAGYSVLSHKDLFVDAMDRFCYSINRLRNYTAYQLDQYYWDRERIISMAQPRRCFLITVPCIILLCPQFVFAGIEEFRFVDLQIRVFDESDHLVKGAFVKAYSKDWPLAYPHSGFSRTTDDGTCNFRLPRGHWTIVVGGGRTFNNQNSGRGLFLVSDMVLEQDTLVELKPKEKNSFFLVFHDRSEKKTNLDKIYASPSSFVPNCLMPEIGKTKRGRCYINSNVPEQLALFLIRKPASTHEGYFIFLDRVSTSQDQWVRSAKLKLNHIHFDGKAQDNSQGMVGWNLCFPYQDIERRLLHTSFEIRGEADAFLTPHFINYKFWINCREENCQYAFHYQGLDFSETPEAVLTAGGPLKPNLSILRLVDDNRTQFLFGPVYDSYGNILQYYGRSGDIPRIPITVRKEHGGPILYSSSFDVKGDHLGFQVDQVFPPSSVFYVDWDLGPFGGSHNLVGQVHQAQYQYRFDTIHTDHFDIHAPDGHHGKAVALAGHLERAYSIFIKWIGKETPNTPERNFFIQPVGLWASPRGQELFLHGFHWWHPKDPASLGWEGASLHEIGHRIEAEHFRIEEKSCNLQGVKNEVIASLLAQLAIEGLHGKKFARFHRGGDGEGKRFFDYLRNPNAVNKGDNLRFFIQTYIPKRYGSIITRDFFERWNETWIKLRAQGFSQDEAFAALYCALTEEELWWIFDLCGFQSSHDRIASAVRLIEP